MTRYRDKVEAQHRGDRVVLRLVKDRAAEHVAFDMEAELLDRVLAGAASAVMRRPVVEATLNESRGLKDEIARLALAQAGRVRAEGETFTITVLL